MEFLRLKELVKKTGLPRSCVYRGMAAGTFPAAVPITGRTVAWVLAEVEQWMADRIAARGQNAK